MAKKKKNNRGDGLPTVGRPLKRAIQGSQIASSKTNSRQTLSHGEMFGADHPSWYDSVLTPVIMSVEESMWPICLSPNMVVMGVKMNSDTFRNKLLLKIKEVNAKMGQRCIVCGYLKEELPSFILGYEWTYCIVACGPGAVQVPKWLGQGHIQYFLKVQNIQTLEFEEAEEVLENLRHLMEPLDSQE